MAYVPNMQQGPLADAMVAMRPEVASLNVELKALLNRNIWASHERHLIADILRCYADHIAGVQSYPSKAAERTNVDPDDTFDVPPSFKSR